MGFVYDPYFIFIPDALHEHPAVAELMLQLNKQDRAVAHEINKATEAA